MNSFSLLYRGLVRPFLRAISPVEMSCRFEPTCGVYAEAALREHGVWQGSRLAVRRLLQCHPLSSGGFAFDPVPPARTR